MSWVCYLNAMSFLPGLSIWLFVDMLLTAILGSDDCSLKATRSHCKVKKDLHKSAWQKLMKGLEASESDHKIPWKIPFVPLILQIFQFWLTLCLTGVPQVDCQETPIKDEQLKTRGWCHPGAQRCCKEWHPLWNQGSSWGSGPAFSYPDQAAHACA